MLEGLPSTILKTIDTPVGKAPFELPEPPFAADLYVVPPAIGSKCRCGCGREVNVGDVWAGEECQQRHREAR
jgi:hypothetical protein